MTSGPFQNPRLFSRVGFIAFGLLLVAIAGLLTTRSLHRRSIYQHVWRIGANQAPPYNYLNKDGSITGFAVDLLNEVAERRGIRLEWIAVKEGPDVGFRTRRVELWPLLTVTEERKRQMHLTEPVVASNFLMVSLASAQLSSTSQLKGRKVSTLELPILRSLLGSLLPDSQLRYLKDWDSALEAVCTGETAAAVIGRRSTTQVLLNRPLVCTGIPLEATPLPIEQFLAIGSVPEAAEVAETLRDAIVELADDKATPIYAKWLLNGSTETRLVDEAARQRSEKRLLGYGLGVSSILLAFAIFQVYRVKVTQRALEVASREAQQASRTKSAFLANMSHEIRTPIHGVMGTTDLLLMTNLDEEQRDYAKTVAQAAQSLLHLINDILDYSKIEESRLEIESISFNLRTTLTSAMDMVSANARVKDLELKFRLDPKLPENVLGDPNRLRQVLVNLLANAVKFTSSGFVELCCQFDPSAGDAETFMFSITDSGIGISPEVLPRLFTAFSQGDSSTTRKYGGTGLGLSISKQLVVLMGGEIHVESNPGQGSRFWFTLPLRQAIPSASGSDLRALVG